MGKGQITLFVVLGIILLIISLLLSYFTVNMITSHSDGGTFDTEAIEFLIVDCIRKTGNDGLELLGKNGNYIDIPELIKFKGTAYWIYKQGNIQPVFTFSIDDFEKHFNKNFMQCVDFSSFLGYDIKYRNANVSIDYGAENVILKVNFPLNITHKGKSKTLEDFTVISNIRYRRVLEKARDIVDAHYNPNFNYQNALEFVDEEDFDISYEIIDQDNLLFTIVDKNQIDYRDYVFNFGTNLEKNYLRRRVSLDEDSLNFFMPFMIYSPDRMAVLMLNPGVKVNVDEIEVWSEYPTSISRSVTNQVTHTDGEKDSSGQTTINYILDYPIYNFKPDGTKFNSPQRLAIYWDNNKIPNKGNMGMLYRGRMSDNLWRPIQGKVNYEENFVYADISGFSEFTIVDCARQECKTGSVKAKSEPESLCMGWLMMLLIVILVAILVAAAAFSIVAKFIVMVVLAIIIGAVLGIGAGVAAYIMIDGAGFEEGTTSIGIIPTCDQIIEASCKASDKLEEGDGTIAGTNIPKGGVMDIDGIGGEEMSLTAVAKKCKKDAWKCYPCDITCTAAYK